MFWPISSWGIGFFLDLYRKIKTVVNQSNDLFFVMGLRVDLWNKCAAKFFVKRFCEKTYLLLTWMLPKLGQISTQDPMLVLYLHKISTTQRSGIKMICGSSNFKKTGTNSYSKLIYLWYLLILNKKK